MANGALPTTPGAHILREKVRLAANYLSDNKTMIIGQYSSEPPEQVEIVGGIDSQEKGLRTLKEVFNYFKPLAKINSVSEDGSKTEEELKINGMSDFSPDSIISQSPTMSRLSTKQKLLLEVADEIRNNQKLVELLKNKETKEAFKTILRSVKQMLEQNGIK